MIKYSIILRAYNAEKQIKQSIESIICQSYENWELIIVNDGSIDHTGEISDSFSLTDKRIKVIHQENRGCILATQKGIIHATGAYICVLDTDDWYDRKYLEIVNSIIVEKNPDMVVTNYNVIYSEQKKKLFCLTEQDVMLNRDQAVNLFLETTNYALWNKIIKKELLQYSEEEKEFFNVNMKTTNFGEDLYQLMPVIGFCEKIYFSSSYLYNYMMDETSISHQNTNNHWQELKKRNQLMEFAYNALDRNQCINEKTKLLIQKNTIVIMMPSIIKILKTGKINTEIAKELKNNIFYNSTIMKTSKCQIKKWMGRKKMYAFYIFNGIIRYLSIYQRKGREC